MFDIDKYCNTHKLNNIDPNIDYQNSEDNNLWYCGKCHTPKQVIINGKKLNCICKCEEEKRNLIEKKETHKKKLEYCDRISENYKNVFFKDVSYSKDKDYIFALNYVNNFDYMKKNNIGLYIYGDFGNGKTTITSCIANELVEKEYSVLMISCNEAIEKFSDYIDFRNKIREFDLVILDDFGSNRETDFQIERLGNLIDYRYASKKPLILTSNIDRVKLADKDSFNNNQLRIFDRIIQMTQGVKIDVLGKRKQIAREKMAEVKNILFKQEEQ